MGCFKNSSLNFFRFFSSIVFKTSSRVSIKNLIRDFFTSFCKDSLRKPSIDFLSYSSINSFGKKSFKTLSTDSFEKYSQNFFMDSSRSSSRIFSEVQSGFPRRIPSEICLHFLGVSSKVSHLKF